MRLDIQSPFSEGLDFVLLLRNDDRHFRFLHPAQLAFQLLRLLLRRRLNLCLEILNFRLPIFLHEVIHAHAGHFIQADKHRLAARPEIGVVAGKVFGNRPQTRLRRQQMDLLGELRFELVLLIHVEIRVFYGVQNPICDLRVVKVKDLLSAVLVIQRDSRAVLHGSLEVIDRNIAAKGAGGDVVARQKRRSGKADARRRRQQLHHVIGKDTVLAAVRLVRHDDNIVVGIDRRGVGLIEFLDQRKDEAGIPFQFLHEIVPARGDKLRCFGFSEQPAVFKRVADLLVQLVAIRQDHERRRTGKFSPNLLREEHHGITLAAALRMPEHAELPVVQLAAGIGLHRLIHAEILVVAGKDLCRAPAGVVVKNEVFQKIEEVFLPADAAQHRFQRNAAGVGLRQTLPLVEKLVFAAERADLRLRAV